MADSASTLFHAKNDIVLAALGQNVHQLSEVKQLALKKLAEFASLDPTYIGGIQRGLRNPQFKNVEKIAKAPGVTTSELSKGVAA